MIRRWGWLLGLGLVLYLGRAVLPPFVLAIILAYLLNPLVDGLTRRLRLPRWTVIAGLYLFMLSGLGALLAVLVPAFVHETRALARHAPAILTALFVQITGTPALDLFGRSITPDLLLAYFSRSLDEALGRPGEALHVAALLVEGVLGILVTLVVTFYLLLHGRAFLAYLLHFVPAEHHDRVRRLGRRVNHVLGGYLRGQLFLVVLMASATYLALGPGFHLPYALPIALATGILEVIPFVGPVVAATIAAGVGLVQLGPQAAVGIILVYFVLRQLEDHLVMPIVLGRAVALHPAVTIFAVLTGGTLAGVLGVLLAVPVAATVKVVLEELYPPEPAGSCLADPTRPGQPASTLGGERQ